jgi:hypothetical protein
MKESYGEGLAIHTGPESCGAARKGGVEALTGERAGRVFSRERHILRDADAVGAGGRQHRMRRYSKAYLRGHRPRARMETPRTGTGRSRVRPGGKMLWDASGSLRMYADDERTWEVGQTHSTGEVSEQGRATGGGGDGGKGFDQGKSATAKRVPDSEPDRRAQRTEADTSSSK